jgi:glycosyltransferase involved in cell wall biosynthesis
VLGGGFLKRIKVLQVLEATGGGTKKHLITLVTGMNRDRFHNVVACPSIRHPSFGDESIVSELTQANIPVEIVEMRRSINPWSDLASLVRLYLLMRKGRYDIVHTHSSKAGFLGRLAARMAGISVIVHTPHGLHFLGETGLMRMLYLSLERLAGLFTDKLIAVSQGERLEVINNDIVSADKIVVLENAIDIEDFRLEVDIPAKKQELGLELNAPVVGTVSRLKPQKDPYTLVQAVAQVIEVVPQTRFVWCGDGELRRETETLARRLGIHRNFVFTGFRKDVLEIVALFDVFVLSSLFEGLPYTILEAMALGKPVIATNVAGSKDIVVDGQTGFLVPPRDPHSLAGAILSLIRDSSRARQMGNAGRTLVEQEKRFHLNGMISRVELLYEGLVDEGVAD